MQLRMPWTATAQLLETKFLVQAAKVWHATKASWNARHVRLAAKLKLQELLSRHGKQRRLCRQRLQRKQRRQRLQCKQRRQRLQRQQRQQHKQRQQHTQRKQRRQSR